MFIERVVATVMAHAEYPVVMTNERSNLVQRAESGLGFINAEHIEKIHESSSILTRSTHQLPNILRRPPDLSETQASLNALQELSCNLITHHMSLITLMQLLSRTTLVNTNHSDTNRPSSFPDTKS